MHEAHHPNLQLQQIHDGKFEFAVMAHKHFPPRCWIPQKLWWRIMRLSHDEVGEAKHMFINIHMM